ncbi:hypothetical protein ACLB2K_058563 [Fragaria x ananassa]
MGSQKLVAYLVDGRLSTCSPTITRVTEGLPVFPPLKLKSVSFGEIGEGSEIVLDLFCGTGTIGLSLARRAKHVYGYEIIPQTIADACLNAELNGIRNATFVQGDLNKIDENLGNNFPKPDVVISDPNRPGMHMKLIKFLLKLKASRIVYVSCNPATCASDLDYRVWIIGHLPFILAHLTTSWSLEGRQRHRRQQLGFGKAATAVLVF